MQQEPLRIGWLLINSYPCNQMVVKLKTDTNKNI